MTARASRTRTSRDAGTCTWVEVRVAVSEEAAEAVAEILREVRAGGLIEERPAPGRVRFRCHVPRSGFAPAMLRVLRERIRGLIRYGLDPGRVSVGRRYVAGRRWATAWRAYARPVRIGPLVIRPSWVRIAPRPGETIVAIDPGMAFGTGMHPSTRLALRGLVQVLRERPGAVVFDVGTGSGVLAIAAAVLGASRIWAADCDPVATVTARTNARLNGVARRVRVARAIGLGAAPGRAGVIVANIVADTVVDLLPDVPAHLAPGGVFIGSGIVTGRVRGVLRAARDAGFSSTAVLREGEWRAVLLIQGASAGTASDPGPPDQLHDLPSGARLG